MVRHSEKTTETVTIIFCVTSPHTERKAFFFISIKKSLQAFAKHSKSLFVSIPEFKMSAHIS